MSTDASAGTSGPKQQQRLEAESQRHNDAAQKVQAEIERARAAEMNAQHVASRARAASAEMRTSLVDIQSKYESRALKAGGH